MNNALGYGYDVKRIDLAKLINNPDNTFKMLNISRLMQSIEEYGLISPIEVYPSDTHPGSYVINAGHRRAMAYTQLFEKYQSRCKESKEPYFEELMNRFSAIDCHVLSTEELENKKGRFLDSNFENRQIDFATAIIYIDYICEKLQAQDKEFMKKCFADGQDPAKALNMKKEVSRILTDICGFEGCSEATIGRYFAVINKGSLPLIHALKEGTITPFKAHELSTKFSNIQQSELVKAIGTEDFDSKLSVYKNMNNKAKKESSQERKTNSYSERVENLESQAFKIVKNPSDQNTIKSLLAQVLNIIERYTED
jgi:hypothetical protein